MGRKSKKGVNINIHVTGSLCCTAETNTTLLSNCTPIKINKYKIKFRKTKRNDKLKKKKKEKKKKRKGEKERN